MSYVYARDLKKECRTDAFMGAGFEAALKRAEDHDADLIVGEFVKGSKWEEA
jgi:hypothetical protein